jgi:hypothetical protein
MVTLYEPNASFVLFDSGQVVTGRAAIREALLNALTLKLKIHCGSQGGPKWRPRPGAEKHEMECHWR